MLSSGSMWKRRRAATSVISIRARHSERFLSWATRHRWRSMPTAICMACGRQNSDKTISPIRADTRKARSGPARRGRFCYSRTSLVCSISTGHSASRPECCRYAFGSIRHAIPQPAESSRGTGISLPGIPFCLQKASSSMTAEVV